MGIMTVRRMGIGSRRYRLACKGAVVVHGAKEGHQVVVGSIIVRCHIVLEYDRASYCRLVFVSGRRCSRELQEGSSKWECQQFNIGGNKLKEKVSTRCSYALSWACARKRKRPKLLGAQGRGGGVFQSMAPMCPSELIIKDNNSYREYCMDGDA